MSSSYSEEEEEDNPINSQLNNKQSNILKMMLTLPMSIASSSPESSPSSSPQSEDSLTYMTDDQNNIFIKIKDMLVNSGIASTSAQDEYEKKENSDNE